MLPAGRGAGYRFLGKVAGGELGGGTGGQARGMAMLRICHPHPRDGWVAELPEDQLGCSKDSRTSSQACVLKSPVVLSVRYRLCLRPSFSLSIQFTPTFPAPRVRPAFLLAALSLLSGNFPLPLLAASALLYCPHTRVRFPPVVLPLTSPQRDFLPPQILVYANKDHPHPVRNILKFYEAHLYLFLY